MKNWIAMIMTAAMLTGALSGCSGEKSAPLQRGNLQAASSAALPAPASDVQVSPAATPDASEKEKNLTELKSDFGYTIFYEEDSVDYRRAEGYDEFVLTSDEVDKPVVFISISHVGTEFVDQMKAAELGEAPESCTIGQAQIQAQCSETEDAWDGGKVIRKTYVYPLDSGDVLLINTQRYTEQTQDSYAAWLLDMVNSIQV